METIMDQKNYPPAALAWLVWGLGAAFYFSGFYHRVAPAVMTDQLMTDFHIGAAGLGNFTAFYFYSYFLMQVPTGILADHWGPRKLLTAGSFVAACGTFLFASASSIIPANLGRFLIGGAAGVGYVALLTLVSRWFPPRFFATVSGLTLFCGVGGAVSAGAPLRFLVERFGWRPVMFVAAAVLLLIGTAIWRIVNDDPAQRGYRSFAPPDRENDFSFKTLLAGLMMVLRYKNVWRLSLVGLAAGSVTVGFAFVKESVPPRFAGTATGIYNMGSILGAMILQPAIGWMLDRNWQGALVGEVRIYDLAAYRSGFVLIIAFSLLTVLSVGFTTETHCLQTVLGNDGKETNR